MANRSRIDFGPILQGVCDPAKPSGADAPDPDRVSQDSLHVTLGLRRKVEKPPSGDVEHDAFMVDYDRFCPAVAEYMNAVT